MSIKCTLAKLKNKTLSLFKRHCRSKSKSQHGKKYLHNIYVTKKLYLENTRPYNSIKRQMIQSKNWKDIPIRKCIKDLRGA